MMKTVVSNNNSEVAVDETENVHNNSLSTDKSEMSTENDNKENHHSSHSENINSSYSISPNSVKSFKPTSLPLNNRVPFYVGALVKRRKRR